MNKKMFVLFLSLFSFSILANAENNYFHEYKNDGSVITHEIKESMSNEETFSMAIPEEDPVVAEFKKHFKYVIRIDSVINRTNVCRVVAYLYYSQTYSQLREFPIEAFSVVKLDDWREIPGRLKGRELAYTRLCD